MNTRAWFKGLICAAALIAAGSVLASAQESAATLQPKEMKAIKAKAQSPTAVSVWVVTMEFTGSFESVQEHMAQFQKEWESQKPLPAGATKPTGVLILEEDPTGKGQFQMSVGSTASAGVKVREPLKIRQVSFPEAVTFTHVGPYQELASVYHRIDQVRPASFPVVMKLLQGPTGAVGVAAPPQIRTQLIVPVKGK
jgi:GyrI-like small molecule binding domain